MSTLFFRFLPFFIFLTFFKFGGGLHYSLISPLGEQVMPLWIVGLLMGGGSIIQLLLDVPAGKLLDRYGYRRLLKVTTSIFMLAAICYMFGFTKTTYVISIVTATFGWLFFGPGVNAYTLSSAPREHAGKFISLRDVFASVGIVLSSAALPFVLLFDPKHIGYVLFGILGVALIMLFFSPKDQVSVHLEKKIPTQHHYIRRHPITSLFTAMKRLNPASTMLLLMQMSGSIFYGTIWFVVPLVIAHMADGTLLGIGLGIFDFAIVLLGFALGGLADKANKRTLVFFGLLLFSISSLFIGFNFNWIFLILGFLATTGDEMAEIALWSWLHALDKDHDQDGAISGVINFFEDLGWAIGPIVAGIIYTIVGPSWTILIGALPIFAVWLAYWLFVYPHHIRLGLPGLVVPPKPHRQRHHQ